jgi:hypothetical protein
MWLDECKDILLAAGVGHVALAVVINLVPELVACPLCVLGEQHALAGCRELRKKREKGRTWGRTRRAKQRSKLAVSLTWELPRMHCASTVMWR